MDWQGQGGKSSVCVQSRDSLGCAKLSPLDVVPSCPVTVCVQRGLDQPFPEAAEARAAPSLALPPREFMVPITLYQVEMGQLRMGQKGPHGTARHSWAGQGAQHWHIPQAAPWCSIPETGRSSHCCCC